MYATIDLLRQAYAKLSVRQILLAVFAAWLIYETIQAIYTAFFGPLSAYPGPRLRALTVLPKLLSDWRGTDPADVAALHARYGPIVRVAPRLLSYTGGTADTQIWVDIYRRPATLVKDPVFYFKPVNGVADMFSAEDEPHARQRKLFAHALNERTLKAAEPKLKAMAAKMARVLKERGANGSVDMVKMYNCTTFDIMSELAFSEDLGMLDKGEYDPWVAFIFKGTRELVRIKALQRLNRVTNHIIERYVLGSKTVQAVAWDSFRPSIERADRRLSRTPPTPDLWTPIIAHGGLTREEHHSNTHLFMVAGTETTATALSGTTYHLLRTPSAVAKLTTELRTAFPAGFSSPAVTLDALAALPYLNAVLHEGLRMYPPVATAMPRLVAAPAGATIAGRHVPAGTVVGIPHHAAFRARENFSRGDEFVPERWLPEFTAEGAEFQHDRRDLVMPFSFGPRNCIGQGLAWHELRLLLAAVVLGFEVELDERARQWGVGQKVYIFWGKERELLVRVKPVDETA